MKLRVDQVVALVVVVILASYFIFRPHGNTESKMVLPAAPANSTGSSSDGAGGSPVVFSIETFGIKASSERLRYSLPGLWKKQGEDLRSKDVYEDGHSQRVQREGQEVRLTIDIYDHSSASDLAKKAGQQTNQEKIGNYLYTTWQTADSQVYVLDDPVVKSYTVILTFSKQAEPALLKTVIDSVILTEPDQK